jgi:hypothetical protein
MKRCLAMVILMCLCTVAASAATVTVTLTSPTPGASVTSPVVVSARASSTRSITGWRIYVDSVSAYQAGAASSISTSLKMSPGTHRLTVRAWVSTGNNGSTTATVNVVQPSTVGVSITPSSATIQSGSGKTQSFTASVSGTTNTGVTWSLSGVGSLSYSGNTATYTAPTSGSGTATLKATSVADNTKSASAGITVTAAPTPVSVSVSPSTATIQSGSANTQSFTASVSGTTNTGVTWSLSGVGSLSYSGNTATYLAPTSGSGTATLTATSVADTTKSASAGITVTAAPTNVSVSVSPSSVTVPASGTQQFNASVSGTTNTGVQWQVNGVAGGSSSMGTITSTGFYTAPPCSATSGVTVTALSLADNTSKGSSAVTLSGSSSSNQRYVSPSGSDSNDGSACRPWATLAKAASSVTAGQTVNVLPGTYNLSGTLHIGTGGSFSSGSCSSRVVFKGTSYDKSARSWGAKLVANNFQAISLDTTCVDVVGLDISVINASTNAPAVKMNYNGTRLLDNHVHGALGSCVLGGSVSFYDTVDGNQIDTCGAQDHSSNLDHGIYVTGNYETITNNLIFNASAYCIVLYNSVANEPQNGVVSSNTVWGCKYGIGVNGATANNYVANNLIRNNLNNGINFTSNGSGNVCTNNLIYSSGTMYGSNLSCSNTKTSDPMMVNFQSNGSGDYRLQLGSPAIGAGTSTNAPKADFQGTARPGRSGFDMGAFQNP